METNINSTNTSQPLPQTNQIPNQPSVEPQTNKLINPFLYVVGAIVFMIIGAFGYGYFQSKTVNTSSSIINLPTPSPTTTMNVEEKHGLGALNSFPEAQNICSVAIDYTTSVKKVDGSESGNNALQEYVAYMKKNNLEDANGAVDWQFKGVQPGVRYQNKIYWLVNFHYFTKSDKTQGGNAQLYISEDGQITRLLGCI